MPTSRVRKYPSLRELRELRESLSPGTEDCWYAKRLTNSYQNAPRHSKYRLQCRRLNRIYPVATAHHRSNLEGLRYSA